MYKQTMGFMKGIAAGAAVGVAAAVIGEKAMRDNKHLRRSAHKAAHAVTGLANEVGSMMKQ